MRTAKTADRTLDVFELFAHEQRPLNLSELAALLGIPVSSAHALIKTLQVRGYLCELSRRQGYFPTQRLEAIAQSIKGATPLLQTVRPILAALRDETGETVGLAKRQGEHVTYVDVFESSQSVRFSPAPGATNPLYTTASGKAILSCLPPGALEETLAQLRLDRLTPTTITSRVELRRQIERCRKRGWFHMFGETRQPDLMAIAAPIRLGETDYAVLIGGPTSRFKPIMARHVNSLLRACAEISTRIAAAT